VILIRRKIFEGNTIARFKSPILVMSPNLVSYLSEFGNFYSSPIFNSTSDFIQTVPKFRNYCKVTKVKTVKFI